MRKLILIALALFLGLQVQGQTEVYKKGLEFSAVQEASEKRSTGFENAFSIYLPTDNPKLATKVWKDYVSSRFNGRAKYNRKGKEYISEEVMTPVTSYPINLVSKTEKFGGQVKFTLWLDQGETYLTSEQNPGKVQAIEDLLNDFHIQVEKEKVRLHLLEEEKELRKLEHKLARLERANARYHKEIELAKQRILQMEDNIIKNELDQITASDEIKTQQNKVESV
ncbi:MAG: hypothetical protein AAF242_10380, partial [Bacteroidota bacterium]